MKATGGDGLSDGKAVVQAEKQQIGGNGGIVGPRKGVVKIKASALKAAKIRAVEGDTTIGEYIEALIVAAEATRKPLAQSA